MNHQHADRHDRQLQKALRGLVPAAQAVENLGLGEQTQEFRVGWTHHGTVVNKSLNTRGAGRANLEVLRTPNLLLARPADVSDSCWWRGGPEIAHLVRPIAPEVALLRSAVADGGVGTYYKGTVSARPLLQLIGTDHVLRQNELLVDADARVPAEFGVSGERVTITVDLARALRTLGKVPRVGGNWTWDLQFDPLSTVPTEVPAEEIIDAALGDSEFESQLRECDNRLS